MSLAAILAAALTDHSARSKALYIDGLDVLNTPGAHGNRPGTRIGSIALTEAGPGQVSSLTWDILDPAAELTIKAPAFVRFEDLQRGVPLFTGFLQTPTIEPLGVGRTIHCNAIGIEVLLDWIVVPPMTLQLGWPSDDLVGSVLGGATGIGYMPYHAPTIGVPNQPSTQASPCSFGSPSGSGFAVTWSSPITLRDAVNQIGQACASDRLKLEGVDGVLYVITLDFYGGLRVWDQSGQRTPNMPSDWRGVTFAAPVTAPSNLRHAPNGDAVHAVYIQSSTPAGCGLEVDGTGLPGQVAVVIDNNSVNDSTARAIAQRYFNANGETVTGSVDAEELFNVGSVGAEVHAGAQVTITDAQVGLNAASYPINQIQKTFLPSGTEMWTITYGSRTSSGAEYIRALTRATLS